MTYKLKAYAKINLSLDVVSKRKDGYHNLESVMHTVPGLYDELTITETDTASLEIFSDKDLCPLEKNIIYKVYEAFYKKVNIEKKGFSVHLKKNIPDKAGLAGGSSDGAEFLKFLNRYHDNPLSKEECISLGAGIGADIPFLIKGDCCLCEGIGEILTPLPTLKNLSIIIAKPCDEGLSTPQIFSALKINEITKRPDTKKLISALYSDNQKNIISFMYNVLEDVSKKHSSVIGEIEQIMLNSGALCSMMSGSGNAVFGLFEGDTSEASRNLMDFNKDLFISESRL